MDVNAQGLQSKEAARQTAQLSTEEKNRGLLAAAKALEENCEVVLQSNKEDVANAEASGLREALLDRLRLTAERVRAMAKTLEEIALQPDPVGEVIQGRTMKNGLKLTQVRAPLGVIGVIYESRPNVTVEAFGLCFKAGNSVLLRGGKDAIASNLAIVKVIQGALEDQGLPALAIQLVEDTSHEAAQRMMQMNGVIDVLIPRGGPKLIHTVIENSTVPVIETGLGNCHIYVDEFADLAMAISIIENAKVQRPGVCNACESILVHEKHVGSFLPMLDEALPQVEIRGDDKVCQRIPRGVLATEEDWATEYLDLVVAVKVVSTMEEALAHIQAYSTGHSEAIITNDYGHAQKFIGAVDSAAVYVNASTRFTDGGEFGFGGEVGISTQKLHARGPMGLRELTSGKYVIEGSGQIRL